jgi:hypothetical protein
MDLRGVEDLLRAAESIPSTEIVLDLEAEAEDSTDRLQDDNAVFDDKISGNP